MVSTFPPTRFARRQQDVILHVQDARGAVGPLQQPADAHEMPAFAVRHGRVRDALEKMRARDDALEKFVRTGAKQLARGIAVHEKVEAVDLLPHLAGDLFARGARIFARLGDDRSRSSSVLLLQRHEIDRRAAVRFFVERIEKLVLLQRADDRIPVLLRIEIRLVGQIEQQLEIHLGDARVVLRPLDVAAHPIKRICDAA